MSKLNGITDVFFDLDHTLWDFEKNSTLTFDKIFKINTINVDLNAFLNHYKTINFNYWKLYREEKITKDALRFRRLDDTFKILGVEIEVETINKLSHDYIENLTSFNYLLPNALEILEYLKQSYILHIITNGFHEVQQNKLDKSNLTNYFKTITNSEIAGVKKPNPQIFHFALQSAQVNANAALMIGDDFEADIKGALNVNMDAILLSSNAKKSDNKIKSVSNLMGLKYYL